VEKNQKNSKGGRETVALLAFEWWIFYLWSRGTVDTLQANEKKPHHKEKKLCVCVYVS